MLEDHLNENPDEDLTIKSVDGQLSFGFENKETKENFIKIITNSVKKSERIKEEGYKCGHCAAYPCFRTSTARLFDSKVMQELYLRNPKWKEVDKRRVEQEAQQPAGLCFQPVRLCRDECNYFLKNEGSGKAPEFKITGVCEVDNSKVNYTQECHIPSERTKAKK